LEENNHHSMVLYDDAKYGTAIKKQFIENGLKKGEHAICFTPDDVNLLEKEIASSGIDVDSYKQKNLLHFYHIEDITKRADGIKPGFDDIVKQVAANSKPPFRFVGKSISDVSTKEGMLAELEIERIFHSGFEKYHCSFLCPYDISGIEPKKRPQWLRQLFSYHHNLIYATTPEKAVTIDTDLLTLDSI
jgi:hypothetical protein